MSLSGKNVQRRSVSDLLVERGVITEAQFVDASRQATEKGQRVIKYLVQSGMATEAQVVNAIATAGGYEFVELQELMIDGSALGKLNGDRAKKINVIPIGWRDGKLVIATAEPANVISQDDIRSLTGCDIMVVVATKRDIEDKLKAVYRAEGQLAEMTSAIDVDDEDLAGMTEATEDSPIIKFVNLLITQAIADRASDIHIEPTEHDLRVRYRIDGVLHETMRSPKNITSGVTSRLKIMADINIAERRIPQDGRLSVNSQSGQKIDLRVATLPTVWGEKIVMRILDNSNAMLSLSDLGFAPKNYTRFEESFIKPYGMILVTGPTGSGKSTTLYATLNIVSSPDKNVITVEDPVEYRLPGINQVQTNNKAGLTFASALRSILRSDPDVVLIGEIRDHETAQIAIEAALTGHLVLSTLHTNDAPSAITRLIEMGIEPFLVGSALDCVLAQRLCRKLCVKCKEPYTPEKAELDAAKFPYTEGEPMPTLYRAVGCHTCSKTGYKGRMALHEVMPVSEKIERLAVQRVSAEELSKSAREDGMVTLKYDGWLKVGDGLTSIEEILRVVV